MQLGLLGRKVGMTRVFADDGSSIPVTVLDVSNNRISQLKRVGQDGYSAVQLTFGTRRSSRVSKSAAGHFAKAGVESGSVSGEFPIPESELQDIKAGDIVKASVFSVGQMVDVSARSIGKGFAGAIKRHHFSSQRASHGNSVSHNAPGSIGMAQDPGRVFPGKRMAGHLGDKMTTVQNLEVIRIDEVRQLVLIKGAVPGARGGDVVIVPAIKTKA